MKARAVFLSARGAKVLKSCMTRCNKGSGCLQAKTTKATSDQLHFCDINRGACVCLGRAHHGTRQFGCGEVSCLKYCTRSTSGFKWCLSSRGTLLVRRSRVYTISRSSWQNFGYNSDINGPMALGHAQMAALEQDYRKRDMPTVIRSMCCEWSAAAL